MTPPILAPVVYGESLRSFLARTFAMNRMGRLELQRIAFDRRWLEGDWALPTQLCLFARRIGVHLGEPSERYWIEHHTLAPFYCATLGAERAAAFAARMAFAHRGPRRPVIALGTGEWFTSGARLCPACDLVNVAERGFSVVMRAWLLPFVTHCTVHGLALVTHPQWTPLDAGPSLEQADGARRTQDALWLAHQSEMWLLHAAGRMERLQVLLRAKGFFTAQGRLRRRALCARLQDGLRERSLPQELAQLLAQERGVMRLLAPLAGGRAALHPTVAICLSAALEDAPDRGVAWQMREPSRRGARAAVARALDRSSGPAGGHVLEAPSLVRQPARQIAKAAGVCVTTAVVQSLALGHKVQLRPKHLTAERRLRVAQMLAAGVAMADIARAQQVSLSSAYRVLASSPQLKQARQRVLKTQKVGQMQGEWNRLVQSHPQASRKQLRGLAPACYAFLYRHSREWLRASLQCVARRQPVAHKRTCRMPASADAALLGRLTAHAGRMPSNRRSSSWLAQVGGRSDASRIDPAVTPQSQRMVLALAERKSEFVQRKLMDGASRVRGEGLRLRAWRVVRASGLRATSVKRARVDPDDVIQQYRADAFKDGATP